MWEEYLTTGHIEVSYYNVNSMHAGIDNIYTIEEAWPRLYTDIPHWVHAL